MEENSPSLSTQLEALFAPYTRSDAPGLVVGVAHEGRALLRKGFGLASIEHAVANTPATRMRIGSTSKHFTCLAILLLAEQGKLDLDDSVRKHLPELPALADEATLRQLMSHTSGYRCHLDLGTIADGLAIQPTGTALSTEQRQTDVNFTPGSKMIYCNGGYHLLSLVIERLSDLSFEQFLGERIFGPLGMVDTCSVPSDFEIHPGMATLHVSTPTGGYRRGIFPSEEVRGEGGIISTIDDMLRWMAHMRGQKTVGSEDSWRQLMIKTRLNDGEEIEYCLGLLRGRYRGVEVIHHAGGVVGGLCQMLTVPGHALDVIIMTNGAQANPAELAHKVIDIVLGDELLGPSAERLNAEDCAPILGRYQAAGSGLIFDLVDVDGVLGLGVLTNPGLPMHRRGTGCELLFSGSGMGPYRVDIPALSDNTPVQMLEFYDCGEADRLERIDEEPPTVETMAAQLGGNYYSADLDSAARISFENGVLSLSIDGRLGGNALTLEPVTITALSVVSDLGILKLKGTLHPDRKGGEVTGFALNTPRTRRLRFVSQP